MCVGVVALNFIFVVELNLSFESLFGRVCVWACGG